MSVSERDHKATSQDGWGAGCWKHLLGLWGPRPLVQRVAQGKIFKFFKKIIDNSLLKGRAHDWGGGRGRGGLFEPGQEEDGELVRGGGQEEVAQVECTKRILTLS